MDNKYSPFGGRTVKTEIEDFRTTEKCRKDQLRENDLHDLTKSINNVRQQIEITIIGYESRSDRFLFSSLNYASKLFHQICLMQLILKEDNPE